MANKFSPELSGATNHIQALNPQQVDTTSETVQTVTNIFGGGEGGLGTLLSGESRDERVVNEFKRKLIGIHEGESQGKFKNSRAKRTKLIRTAITENPGLSEQFQKADLDFFGDNILKETFEASKKSAEARREADQAIKNEVNKANLKKFGEEARVVGEDGLIDVDETFNLGLKLQAEEAAYQRAVKSGRGKQGALKFAFNYMDNILGFNVNAITKAVAQARDKGVTDQQSVKDLVDQFTITTEGMANDVARLLYEQGSSQEDVAAAQEVIRQQGQNITKLVDTVYFDSVAKKSKQLQDTIGINMLQAMPLLGTLKELGMGDQMLDTLVNNASLVDQAGFGTRVREEFNELLTQDPRKFITNGQNLIGMISEPQFNIRELSRQDREKAVQDSVGALRSLLTNTGDPEASKSSLVTLSANLLAASGGVASEEDLQNAADVFGTGWLQGFRRIEQDSRYRFETESIADAARNLHVHNLQAAGQLLRRELGGDVVNEIRYNNELGKFELIREVGGEVQEGLVGAAAPIAGFSGTISQQEGLAITRNVADKVSKAVKSLNNSLNMITELSSYDNGLSKYNARQQKELAASQTGFPSVGESSFGEGGFVPTWAQANDKDIADDRLLNFREQVRGIRERLIDATVGLPQRNFNRPSTNTGGNDELGKLINEQTANTDEIAQLIDSVARENGQEQGGGAGNAGKDTTKVLTDLLAREEGSSLSVYDDSKGIKTVGIGFNMEQTGAKELWEKAGVTANFNNVLNGSEQISQEDRDKLLSTTVEKSVEGVKKAVPEFDNLDPNRQSALVSMAFQMGVSGFNTFKNTLKLINAGKFEEAADNMLKSKWARIDSPARARRAAEVIRTGKTFSEVEQSLVDTGKLAADNRQFV